MRLFGIQRRPYSNRGQKLPQKKCKITDCLMCECDKALEKEAKAKKRGGDSTMLKIRNAASQDTELYLENAANGGGIDLVAKTPAGRTVSLFNFKAGGKVTRYAGVPSDFALPTTRSGRVRVVLYR